MTQAVVSNRFTCTDYPFSLMHMIVLNHIKDFISPSAFAQILTCTVTQHLRYYVFSHVLVIRIPCLSHFMMDLWHNIVSGDTCLLNQIVGNANSWKQELKTLFCKRLRWECKEWPSNTTYKTWHIDALFCICLVTGLFR